MLKIPRKIYALLFIYLVIFNSCDLKAQSFTYQDALLAKKEGNYIQAEKILLFLIKKNPKNAELWFELGLVQRYQQKLPEAMNSQRQALKLSPNNNDIKLEIARMYIWNNDLQQAQILINQILSDNPDYKEAEELALSIKNKKSITNYKWQLDLAYEHSNFARRPLTDWRDYLLKLSHKLSDKTSLHLAAERAKRFNSYNEHYEAGINYIFNSNYNAAFSLGHTPDSTFLPKWRIKASGAANIIHKNQYRYLGNTDFTLYLQNDRYKNSDISVIKPGIYYALSNSVTIHPQLINVIDENNRHLRGWAIRGDWQMRDDLRIFGGYADAPENQNGITINTKTHFTGASYNINQRLILHISYTHDDRENSFIRKVITGALSIKF